MTQRLLVTCGRFPEYIFFFHNYTAENILVVCTETQRHTLLAWSCTLSLSLRCLTQIHDFLQPILGPARAYKEVSKIHHRFRYGPNRDVGNLGRRAIHFRGFGEKDHLYSGIW